MGYAEVAVEMNIIFKYMDEDLVEKIPVELRYYLQSIASSTYVAHIDPRYPLEEQPLLPETEILLAVLFREYWATDEDKAEFDEILHENDLYVRDKYNPENIFKQVEEIKESIEQTAQVPAVQNNETFFEKFKAFCKKVWNTLFHLDDNSNNNFKSS